jgi:hypothetical protein
VKLDRRHMIGSLVILVASIVWNIWVFTQPAERPAGASRRVQPPLGDNPPVAGAGPVDPTTIPAPPPVELTQEPVWTRNPFGRGSGPSPVATTAGPAPPAPADPVVGAIVFDVTTGRGRSAIVDGRVVGVGDRININGAVVLEIARDAVIVQLASGERMRLALKPGGAGRSRTP